MEIIDLVNEEDYVIGQEERVEAVKNGRRNIRVINIFIYNSDNQIILPLRSANRRMFPNCYDFSVGGFVNSGETYEEAAYRELEEELGISGVELKEIGYFHPEDVDTACFSKLYKIVFDGKLNYDHDGIAEVFYLTEKEIAAMLLAEPEKFKRDYMELFNWMIKNDK